MSNVTPARALALEVTSRVRTRSAYAGNLIAGIIAPAGLSPEDRAFSIRLSYGVVATTGVLDEIINRSLRKPTDIQPDVRDALRVSVYEIVFLHKSSYAAVDQGVELVRSVVPRAAGLANAVLRKVVADTKDFPWGDPETDNEALARLNGYPLWLTERFIADIGREDAQALLEATAHPAPLFVGANPFLATDEEVENLLAEDGGEPEAFGVPGCFICDSSPAVPNGETLVSGKGVVCDGSAQLVAFLAAPTPDSTYLEIGSGRGTKTVLLQGNALRAGGTAQLYALDLHEFKEDILRKRLDELKVPRVTALTGDATDLTKIEGLPHRFSGVLIDAPCSGLGTLRRHPEQCWRVTPETIESLAILGEKLLLSASRAVECGGFIVYSTCSVTRRENEDVIERFLNSRDGDGFEVVSFEGALPGEFADSLTHEGFLRSVPSIGGPDGHFAAKLMRIR